MKKQTALLTILILTLAVLQMGMARRAEYDEEARKDQRLAKQESKAEEIHQPYRPVRGIASGVKEATFDSTTGFLEETAEATVDQPPIVGTLEGVRLGSGVVLDKALKGTVKVATLGYGELKHYEVTDPEADSGDPTKITIPIPGT